MRCLAVDIGGTKTAFAVMNDAVNDGVNEGGAGEAAAEGRPEPWSAPTPPTLAGLLELVAAGLERAEETAGEVACVGVAVPGLIAFEHGRIELCSNLPYLTGALLKRDLERSLLRPVALDNDANLAAYGEYAARQASQSLVFVTISTGIGGSYVARDGAVLRGASGRATDFGHIKLEAAGEPCYCGQSGCWETISSGRFLAERSSRALGRTLGTAELFALAERGDEEAARLVRHGAQVAGLALAGLARAFDPEVVVLGGGVGLAPGMYGDVLRESYGAGLVNFGGVPLEPSRLGAHAGVFGAGWFGLREAQAA